jgi:magnesium-transporting ATPase (P-type)
MLQVLILAMAVSFGIQSWIEGGVICAVIILDIVVGFFQEYAAERTMESSIRYRRLQGLSREAERRSWYRRRRSCRVIWSS